MNERLREACTGAALAAAAALGALVFDAPQTIALLVTGLAALSPSLWAVARSANTHGETPGKTADSPADTSPETHRATTDAFLQRLIDMIPEAVYIKDADSRYILANKVFAQQHDKRPEDLIGMFPAQVFDSETYGAMVREEDLRILAGEQIFKEEHAPNPVTGDERFQLVAKQSCIDASGRQVIIGTNFNITRWRVAERNLREAIERERDQRKRTQDFVQRLIDVMPEPIYIKDSQAHFLMVNQAFARERQRPASEIIGLTSFDLAPNADSARMVAEEDAAILHQGINIFKEHHARTPVTGEERFRQVHKRLCQDTEGNPIIVGAHFDITGLRLAERNLQATLQREVALRERVQRYMQRLIDVIPQPVYVKDAQSRYIMVNEAFLTDRELPRDQVLGKLPRDMGSSLERDAMVIAEDLLVLRGQTVNKEEHMPHPTSGELRYRYISKGTCLDAEGEPVIVGANFDITAWREAEAAAEKASAAKSLFLASMSHEIRTPLSGVIGTLRLALHDHTINRETRDYLDVSLSNAESLLSIINDILDFSKIEAGQLTLESIDFDIRHRVRESVQIFRAHAASRSLLFDLDIDPAIPQWLRGDPTRIRQVLSNLVGNAIKFTERGAVNVRIQHLGQHDKAHHISFSVHDTGIGIPEEAQSRLFQKFQQADVSTTRRFGGTGLGLAICRELVEAMGGQISVRSQEGLGTSFSFDLWLEEGEEVAAEYETPMRRHVRKLRILCAEDVAVNQLIVRTQVTHMGHDIDIVETGLAAVRALAKEDYDLVLMDGRMPEMDGAEAARTIRAGGLPDARVLNPQIRIIALTANASDEDRRLYIGAGMDDYLTKPVSERQLYSVIERCILASSNCGQPWEDEENDSSTTTITLPETQTQAHAPLERVMNHFIAFIPEDLAELDATWGRKDMHALAECLRDITTRAEAVGMDDVQELASCLQNAASHEDRPYLEREFPRLRGALASIHECFGA